MTRPPLIVNAALTGMVPTKADNPAVPLTPDEIAADAEACLAAGASIVHVHARDEGGRPTYRLDVYREIVARIRDRRPDAIVCVSTSGRVFRDLEQRAEVLDLDGDLKPELASLTLGSLNFPREASVNAPDTIRGLAERMSERGIVPELEIFDLGMVDYARYLLGRGILRPPLYANVLLGSLGTLAASPLHLALVTEALPDGTTWGATGIGRFQLDVNMLAIAMGGHVRVGLEDSLYLDAEKRRPASNRALVERIAAIAHACERELATPAQAREVIGLPQR